LKQSHANPLLKELAQATPSGTHPDADMLTAFAEGTLLQREKQEILVHLASCADCREILAVTTASSPVPASGPAAVHLRPERRSMRIWLPWAGLATALIVVSVSVLLYQQRAARQATSTIAKDTGGQAPPLLATPSVQQAPAVDQKTQARRDELDRPAKKAQGAAAAAPPPSLAAPQSEPSVNLDAREKSSQQTQQQTQNNEALQNQVASQSGGRNQQQALDAETAGNRMEQAKNAQKDLQSNQEVSQSNANPAPAQSTMKNSAAAFVQEEPQREMAKAAIGGLVRPHWHINAAGRPERSFGNGIWQPVLPQETATMRVISVFAGQVWIGGDHARLYRSADDGAVWTQVTLPEKNGADHAIVHVRFEAPGTITVETSDGITWTSHDNGATWK